MVRLRRPGLVTSVRSPTVVVLNVVGQHGSQVSFTEDQHAIGEFGSSGKHEPLGEAVRSGQPVRIFTTRMPVSARTVSNDAVN